MVSTFPNSDILVANFRLPVKLRRSVYFENFLVGGPKLSYHLHCDRNFQKFWVNGKQPVSSESVLL